MPAAAAARAATAGPPKSRTAADSSASVIETPSKPRRRRSSPLAIGLALVMIHLVSIPVTNTSVNPARSTGPALFVGGWALQQLWMFWVAPPIGGVLGGLIYRWLSDEPAGTVEGKA